MCAMIGIQTDLIATNQRILKKIGEGKLMRRSDKPHTVAKKGVLWN